MNQIPSILSALLSGRSTLFTDLVSLGWINPSAGLVCCLILVLFLHGAIGFLLLRPISPHYFSLPVTNIITGIVFHTVYFLTRSFASHALGFPGVKYWELPLLVSTLSTLILVCKKKPDATKNLGPQKRFYTPGRILLQLLFASAAIALATTAFGRYYIFSPVAVSSDPGVLSSFLELFRISGRVPFWVSAHNPSLPIYPIGFSSICWAFSLGILPSLSVIHLWPFLSLTIAAAVFSEHALFRSRIRSEAVSLQKSLVVIGIACFLPQFILPLALFQGAPHQEGVAKQSQWMLIAYGCCLAFAPFGSRERLASRIFRTSTAMIAFFFLFLVNYINFAISACLIGLGLMAMLLRGGEYSRRVLPASFTVLFCFGVLTMLQDPFLLSRMLSDDAGQCWEPLRPFLPICTVEGTLKTQHYSQGGHIFLGISKPWQTYLPVWFKNPVELLMPYRALATHSERLIVLVWLLSLSFLFQKYKNSHSRRHLLQRIGSIGSVALVFFYALSLLQTYILHTYGNEGTNKVLKTYAELSYLNLFVTGGIFILIWGWVRLANIPKHKFKALVGADASKWNQAFYLLILVALVNAALASRTHARQINGIVGRTGRQNFDSMMLLFANARQTWAESVNFGQARFLSLGRGVVLVGEQWFFPDYGAVAASQAIGFELVSQFSPLLPPSGLKTDELGHGICVNLCSVARRFPNLNGLIVVEPNTRCAEAHFPDLTLAAECLNAPIVVSQSNFSIRLQTFRSSTKD